MTATSSGERRYITPIDSNGTVPAPANSTGPGAYTLLANTTYHFPLGGSDAPHQSVHLTGYTAGAIVTSATIKDCDHDRADVADYDTTAGHWPSEIPTNAYVAVDGTGWSMASAGVGAAAGTGVGGARWNIAPTGAARTRLTVVVGATGGVFRCSGSGKR